MVGIEIPHILNHNARKSTTLKQTGRYKRTEPYQDSRIWANSNTASPAAPSTHPTRTLFRMVPHPVNANLFEES
jgi:hypothetical protein